MEHITQFGHHVIRIYGLGALGLLNVTFCTALPDDLCGADIKSLILRAVGHMGLFLLSNHEVLLISRPTVQKAAAADSGVA
jgi:hypothetical protein